jgi:hypothetical protein
MAGTGGERQPRTAAAPNLQPGHHRRALRGCAGPLWVPRRTVEPGLTRDHPHPAQRHGGVLAGPEGGPLLRPDGGCSVGERKPLFYFTGRVAKSVTVAVVRLRVMYLDRCLTPSRKQHFTARIKHQVSNVM